MRGWTVYEKELYRECGYHNYAEFIDDLESLIIEEYGKDHGILIKTEPCSTVMTKYKRALDDHIFTFDVSNCCEKAKVLGEMMQAEVFSIKGRKIFEMWRATKDIEESIIFAENTNIIKM